MRPTRFRFLALFVAASAITVYGSQMPQWPAGVQKVPAASPALTPAESLKTFSACRPGITWSWSRASRWSRTRS